MSTLYRGTGQPPTEAPLQTITFASSPFRELAKEFRRLAALAQQASESFIRDNDYWRGMQKAYAAAAQMLEERLNG